MSSIPEFESFINGIQYFEDKGNIIPEGMEKNRQYLKDEVLKQIKLLFNAIDMNDKDSVVQLSIKLALNGFAIAHSTGKIGEVVDSFLKETKMSSLKN